MAKEKFLIFLKKKLASLKKILTLLPLNFHKIAIEG